VARTPVSAGLGAMPVEQQSQALALEFARLVVDSPG
jgi:hypothetical protein